MNLNAERRQRTAYLRGRRHSSCGSKCQPNKCADSETESKGSEGAGGEGRAENDRAERREGDEPDGEQANRAYELRSNDDDHGDWRRESDFGIPPSRQRMSLDGKPVGLDSPAEDQRRSDEADGRDEEIARKIPAPAEQDGDDGRDGKA